MKIDYLIYGLADPTTKEIRYVGRSSHGLHRARAHWISKRELGYSYHVANWVKSILKQNLIPDIVVLERTTKEGLCAAEIKWIAYYRSISDRLTNIAPGGHNSPQACRKVIRNDGKVFQSLSDAAYACNASPARVHTAIERNHRLRGWEFKDFADSVEPWEVSKTRKWLGRKFPMSEETRQKISKVHKGKPSSNPYNAVRITLSALERRVPVIRNDGKTYASVTEAAKDIGSTTSEVSGNILGKYKQCKGYTFKRL